MADAAASIGHGVSKAKIPVTSDDEIGMLAGVLNDMSERIEEQVQRLSAEKQRLDTILRSMGEGVMVTAPDGVITLVNPAFRRLFSIAGDVEGKKLVEISRHPDLLEAFTDLGKPDVAELVREISIQPNDMYPFYALGPVERRRSQAGDRRGFPRHQRSEESGKHAQGFCRQCLP